MGLRDIFQSKKIEHTELKLLPYTREASWKPWGWQDHQREFKKAAKALGYADLAPGEHTPDDAVQFVLQVPEQRGAEIIVMLAGQQVGVVPSDERQRVRGRVRVKGDLVPGAGYCAAVPGRLYHWDHGRWGAVVYG